MKIKESMDSIKEGERVEIVVTDAGFARDAEAWCSTTGNQFITKSEEKGKYTVLIEKGAPKACNLVSSCDGKAKTLIMFSDGLEIPEIISQYM